MTGTVSSVTNMLDKKKANCCQDTNQKNLFTRQIEKRENFWTYKGEDQEGCSVGLRMKSAQYHTSRANKEVK